MGRYVPSPLLLLSQPSWEPERRDTKTLITKLMSQSKNICRQKHFTSGVTRTKRNDYPRISTNFLWASSRRTISKTHETLLSKLRLRLTGEQLRRPLAARWAVTDGVQLSGHTVEWQARGRASEGEGRGRRETGGEARGVGWKPSRNRDVGKNPDRIRGHTI